MNTHTGSHVFVYQEWDMLREQQVVGQDRIGRVMPPTSRTSTFSMQMQEARIQSRMTIADLAQKCNVDARAITLFETGTEMPSAELKEQILRILGIDTE